MPTLSQRTRKLIGTFLLLIFLVFYSLLIMTIGVSGHVPDQWAVEALFYLVAGIAWAFPAKYLITWMVKPDAE